MRPRLARATLLCALLGFVFGTLSWDPVRRHASAAKLLVGLGEKTPPRPDATVSDLFVTEGALGFRARLYVPHGAEYRCAVIGHGVQFRGIDEPRLVRFASLLSANGVAVLTPELSELADYQITRQGADVLAASVRRLSALCGGRRVGLLGFSFAGGLSLLAARDPAVNAHLAYVSSVGGYDDLSRVLRFLLTDQVETLHGTVTRKAHEYGLVVLFYEHLDALVPEEDRAVMHPAIKAWLMEDRARAWALASRRTTERAERLFVDLASGQRATLRDALRDLLKNPGPDERALSPAGTLSRIPVPVYLLHGEGDTVIPAEETVWADQELATQPHRALVTPLIEHVELSSAPTLTDRWSLVRFMAALF